MFCYIAKSFLKKIHTKHVFHHNLKIQKERTLAYIISAAYLAVYCVFSIFITFLLSYFVSTQLSKILVYKLASFATILFFMFDAGRSKQLFLTYCPRIT